MGLFKYTFFFFLVIALMMLYVIESTVQHEYIHQLIFQKYGIKSNVTYNFIPAFKEQLQEAVHLRLLDENKSLLDAQPLAYTTPILDNLNSTNYTYNCDETCEMLHTQQEIVDSQTSNIVIVIFVVLILYVLYNEFFSSKANIKREIAEALENVEVVDSDIPKDSRFNIEV